MSPHQRDRSFVAGAASQRSSDPVSYACTQKIGKYLADKFGIALSDEEQLYPMVHLARLKLPAEQQQNSVEKSH